MKPFFRIVFTIPWDRPTEKTVRPLFRSPSSSTPFSTGEWIDLPAYLFTKRSSTRSTSRGLPSCTPGFRAELRATYAGLAHPAMVDYLKGLGVTTVELLPSTSSSTTPTLWNAVFATTGVTTPLVSWLPTMAIPAGDSVVSRCRSSSRW